MMRPTRFRSLLTLTLIRQSIVIAALACVLMVGGGACGWTSDHLVSPTNREGYVPGPPRYLRILEWVRPDMFRAEFREAGKWYEFEYFMVITREESDYPLGEGWYAPNRTQHNPLPELNEAEKAELSAVERQYPPGTVIELDYPLLHDKSKIGRGADVEVARTDVMTSTSWHGAYIIVIKDVAKDDAVPKRE